MPEVWKDDAGPGWAESGAFNSFARVHVDGEWRWLTPAQLEAKMSEHPTVDEIMAGGSMPMGVENTLRWVAAKERALADAEEAIRANHLLMVEQTTRANDLEITLRAVQGWLRGVTDWSEIPTIIAEIDKSLPDERNLTDV